MADKKRRAPIPVREIKNPAYVEADGLQQGKISLPLPDYETLFPQKRHGVQGQTRWDHIIAEVNQRHRVTPEFLGPEMSVDGPEEHEPRSSLPQESPPLRLYQTHTQETKPTSSKKVAAPAPPKSVAPLHPRSVEDSNQRQSQIIAHQSPMRPNPSVVPGPVSTDSSSRESLSVMSSDGARKVLRPSPEGTYAPRPSSQMDWDTTTPPNDQRKVPMNKEAPTARPRQRVSGKEPVQQEDSAVTPVVSDKNTNSNIQTSSSKMSSLDNKGRQTKENFVDFDPFPSSELLSKDPWAQLKQNPEVDKLFTGNVQKEQKLEEQGMTADDLDNIFSQEKPTDPFARFNGSDSNEHSKSRQRDEDSKQVSPAFQRRNSQRRTQILPSTTHSDNKTSKSQQEPAYKEETTITSPQGLARDVMKEPTTLKQADVKTPSNFYGGEDPFGAEPFTVTSASTSTEPLQVVMEEPESQAGGLAGGKTLLRAWVSPSEVQPVSAQNSNGGGLALTPRRPHPVKPMSSAESQHPISTPAVKEIKVRDSTPGKIQVANSVQSGPYTQLTQEELITMVVKQQADLSRKDAKIVELEEYIDNLLVRVIDEKPTILQSLNSAKPL
ncbi:proteoglycan 4 isoform X3 [Enoplosus armatus]|uniref:proteoglycan 4 isoform X3 n=1 Tax=Enoplosus armatus TaxID=215367 RepID=UPI00399460D7